MDWLLIATGFAGAGTLLYLLRTAYHALYTPPSPSSVTVVPEPVM